MDGDKGKGEKSLPSPSVPSPLPLGRHDTQVTLIAPFDLICYRLINVRATKALESPCYVPKH